MPDHLIYPTGDGVGIVGLYKAAEELQQVGVIDAMPRLWAAQAENCAPIVAAWEADAETIEPVAYPDTICGALEVPAPAGGARILTALRESNGGGVAVEDGAILSATVSVAESEGVEMGVAGGAAAAAAWELSASGEIRPEESVAVVNTATGNKDADLARSHLMSQGV
jgi:threonine synthase